MSPRLRLFGFSAQTFVGRPFEELFAERSRPAVRHILDGLSAAHGQGSYLACEDPVWLARADGTEVPVAVSVASHGPGTLIAFLHELDSHGPRSFEAAVLAASAHELHAEMDLETVLRSAASLAARFLGTYAIAELAPGADEPGCVRAAAAQTADSGVAHTLEACWRAAPPPFTLRPPSTARRPLLLADPPPLKAGAATMDVRSVLMVPLAVAGQAQGTLTVLSTVRRHTADDLRIAAEIAAQAALAVENARRLRSARAAARKREEMMEAVAHELGNALAAMKMWANPLGGADVHRVAAGFTGALELTAARLERLVADLRDLDEVESGRFSADRIAAVAPGTLLSAAVEAARGAAAGRKIEVVLAPGLPDVLADEERILQVLANLIDNALKFAPPDAPLTAGAHLGRYPGQVVFFVQDHGPGIPERDQAHVFERGWRGHAQDRRGSGLGLAISKDIIEAHDSILELESQPGEGATFSFALSAAADARAPVEAPAPSESAVPTWRAPAPENRSGPHSAGA